MEEWATQNFQSLYGLLVIYMDTDGNVTAVDPALFAGSNFASVTTPPTHTELSALPIAQQGWQKIFDQWKADGKIQ